MTCRRFVPDVIDAARGVVLEPARHEAVLAHLRDCQSCAALAERQRMMSVALRRIAGDQRVPPADERELQTLLAMLDAGPARPSRLTIGVGLSLAASALIV